MSAKIALGFNGTNRFHPMLFASIKVEFKSNQGLKRETI